MIFVLFVAVLLAAPSIGWAEKITLRSGEHGEFTRLVFDVPENTKWSLEQNDNLDKITLIHGASHDGFNLNNAFDKISKNRVHSIIPTKDSKGVEITLSCDCSADSFLLRDRMLVIDIREKTPSEISERNNPDTSQNYADEGHISTTDLTRIWLGPIPRIGPPTEDTPRPSYVPTAISNQSPSQIRSPKPNSVNRTSDVRNQIFGDLATAATIGLLDPSTPLENPPLMPASEIHTESINNNTLEVNRPTALERSKKSSERVSIGGQKCTPNTHLNIKSWAQKDSPFSLLLATRRGAMFDEFDQVNNIAQTSYVRALIYLGFGAEARSVATLNGSSIEPIYTTLSYLVDGDRDPTGFFQAEIECDTYSSMWSSLDGSMLSSSSKLNVDALLQSFELLPMHLRLHLGPILVENFTKVGKLEIAKSVLRRLERANGGETSSILYGSAKIDSIEGAKEEASRVFRILSETDGPETASAIARDIEISTSKGEAVSRRMVTLSAAYSKELRNTEAGSELWEAHLNSLLVNRLFSEAFSVLDDIEGVDTNLVRIAIDRTFEEIVKNSDDAEFLKVFFDKAGVYKEGIRDETMLLASERFLTLGFSTKALETLSEINSLSETRDWKVLKAKALIRQDQPKQAEIALIGLEGRDVTKLRAESRRKMGDHEYSRELFEELGESEEEIDQAWLSSNWERLRALDPGSLYSSLARTAGDEGDSAGAGNLALSDIENLYSDSSIFREIITKALDTTMVSDQSEL